MPTGRSTFPVVVSVVAVLLLIAVQGRLVAPAPAAHSGAFLLLIFVVAPLFAGRRKGKS